MISMIVAHCKDRAIGKKNTLPWSIPEDLKYFSQITRDRVVVMGENTYHSIGKILSNRTNIIISNNPDFKVEGAIVYNSIEPIVEMRKITDFVIIGGGMIYKSFLPYAEMLYITKIDLELEGADAFFPSYEEDFTCLIDGKEKISVNGQKINFTLWRRKSK